MSQSLRRGWLKVNGQGNVARYVATLATQTQGAASMSAAVASDVVTPAATTILHLPAPISQAGASASILAAAQAAVANSTRRFNFLPEHAPRRAHDAPGAALTRPATYRPAVSPAGAGATGGLSAAVQSVVSSAGGTTRTAPRATRPRPARAAKASATVPAASHQSTIQTVFVPVAKVLTEIPWWVYLALVTAMGCATSSTALAVRNGRRARRQAREIAAASAAAAAASAAAIHDPLTGLLNRRGFENAINRELARAQRHGRPFSIAYADVRGLKAVNDTQGHAAGDTLLKAVSNLLSDAARAGDTIARLGGDEFALLLPENTPHDAHAVTTRIAHAVTHTRTHLNLPHHWDLTIGTAAYPTDGHNADTLLATADRRLYEQRGIALAGTR